MFLFLSRFRFDSSFLLHVTFLLMSFYFPELLVSSCISQNDKFAVVHLKHDRSTRKQSSFSDFSILQHFSFLILESIL